MLKNAGSLVCYVYILFNLALSWSPLLFLHSFALSLSSSSLEVILLFFSVILFSLAISLSSVRACIRHLSLSLSIIFENFIHTRAGTVVLFFRVCVCVYLSLASGDLLLKQLSFRIFIVVNA